jgi:hypothetical protein
LFVFLEYFILLVGGKRTFGLGAESG